MFKALLLKEFRVVLRDYYALLVLFLMPIIFVLIMSMSLKDVFAEKQNTSAQPTVSSLKVSMVFDDKMPAEWRADFLKIDSFEVTEIPNNETAIQQAKAETLSGKSFALIQVPYQLVKKLKRGDPIKQPILILFSPSAPSYVRSLLQAGLVKKLVEKKIAVTLAAGTAASTGKSVPSLDIHAFLGDDFLTVKTLSSDNAPITPSSVQQSVPAWLVFAMFFIVIPFSATLLIELKNGTLERLNTYPISKLWILLGKLLPYLSINLLQTALMFLTGVYLVPWFGGDAIQLGANAWLLLPVSVAISMMAISFALLIAVSVKTHEQASTIGGVSNLLMGAIGGVMVPVFVMPEKMQLIAQYSPMNWGLQAFLEVLLRQGDWWAVMPYILRLTALALGLFALAYWILLRRLKLKSG